MAGVCMRGMSVIPREIHPVRICVLDLAAGLLYNRIGSMGRDVL